MRAPTAPIRFLLLVVGGWVGFRVVAWLPERVAPVREAVAEAAPTRLQARAFAPEQPAYFRLAEAGAATEMFWSQAPAAAIYAPAAARQEPLDVVLAGAGSVSSPAATPLRLMSTGIPAPAALSISTPAYPPLTGALETTPAASGASSQRRLTASAWLFLRDEGAAGLFPGGSLGGSQAGAHLAYRINDDARRPLSASARLYVPVDRPRGSEAAIGLDWQPLAALPLHILAERRQRIGREGRSDFAVTVYGGGERQLFGGRVRVEAYGQVGVVGVEERDLFADGAVTAGARAGPVEIGAGAWGGAQPGVSRLDVGPQATVRIPVGRTNVRASAQYRFRVAGDAAPASGPALTIATDF